MKGLVAGTPVVPAHIGRLIGLLTVGNIGELLALEAAGHRAGGSSG